MGALSTQCAPTIGQNRAETAERQRKVKPDLWTAELTSGAAGAPGVGRGYRLTDGAGLIARRGDPQSGQSPAVDLYGFIARREPSHGFGRLPLGDGLPGGPGCIRAGIGAQLQSGAGILGHRHYGNRRFNENRSRRELLSNPSGSLLHHGFGDDRGGSLGGLDAGAFDQASEPPVAGVPEIVRIHDLDLKSVGFGGRPFRTRLPAQIDLGDLLSQTLEAHAISVDRPARGRQHPAADHSETNQDWTKPSAERHKAHPSDEALRLCSRTGLRLRVNGATMTSPLPIARSIAELRAIVSDWRKQGLSVALVPTMGALHDGHLSLVAEALRQADRVVTSVFVNPTQFAPTEDLATYPRREARDAELLAGAGAHLMYAPPVEEMYPAGAITTVTVGDAETGGPAQDLEGAARPQMFGGVALVVCKLLNQAQPDVAVFGEKDWQQLMVIRRMVADLDIPARILGVAIARDPEGFALSSRNAYLSEAEVSVARSLNAILAEAAARVAKGEAVAAAEQAASAALLAAGFDKVDYVAIRRADDLSRFAQGVNAPARILAAAWLGKTRLIDNMAV